MRKIISIIALVSILTVNCLGQALAYSDTDLHWASKEIAKLSSQKIVEGANGQFYPDQAVTRAQFAKLVVLALGLGEDVKVLTGSKTSFSDVPASSWAAGYITLAQEKGIVTGFSDGTFRPNQKIKRYEIAVMLARALKPLTRNLLALPLHFGDALEVPEWATKEVSQVVQLGLVNGYSDNSFRPNKDTTRAEATALLSRYLNILGRSYDYFGVVSQLDKTTKTITVKIDGRDTIFSYVDHVQVYRNNTSLELTDVGTNQNVYFNLDEQGNITFLELTSDQPATNYLLADSRQQLINKSSVNDSSITLGKEQLMLSEGDGNPKKDNKPEESLAITKAAMKVDKFTQDHGVTGQGQVIAIIDTGVDPGHPDLLVDMNGKKKIIDWVDFTEEGKVTTNIQGVANNGYLVLDDIYTLDSKTTSRSGNYKLGFLKESAIATEGAQGLDMNNNASVDDAYAVLLVDVAQPGVYDTVLIDTNGNRSFTDEIVLKTYKSTQQFTQITGKDGSKFDLVVAEIDPTGSYIKVGFDGNGHGTHVAGIAAANGQIQGVAPGASIIAAKVIGSNGRADWTNIVKAIEYTAKNGAKVINLSLGYHKYDPRGNSWENHMISKIIDKYGVTVVAAAGNNGPGLETMAVPANSEDVISVGAYISPEMWKHELGYIVENESLWYWSSMGPRGDGAFMPTLIAPGSVVSTMNFRGYEFLEGTSMAAPHVSGVVALLMGMADKEKVAVSPKKLKTALALGAKKIPGFSEVDQGYGLVNIEESWNLLNQKLGQRNFSTQVFNQFVGTGVGLYTKGLDPGQVTYKVFNGDSTTQKLQLESSVDWIEIDRKELMLPAGKGRNFTAKFSVPDSPGIYTGLIRGDDPATVGSDLEILNTIIKPYTFTPDQASIAVQGELGAAQFKRYYVQVNPGTKKLDLKLTVPDHESVGYQGRVRMHLYDPDGVARLDDPLQFAGMNPEPLQSNSSVSKVIDDPEAGIWEVVIYSSAMLQEFGLNHSKYQLQMSSDQLEETLVSGGQELIINVMPGKRLPNQVGFVTVQVRQRIDKRPYQGVLEINGKIYSINNGVLILTIPEKEDTPVLKIRTLGQT